METPNQRCTRCGETKPQTLKFFPAKKAMASGFSSWCRECFRQYAKVNMRRKRSDPGIAPVLREQRRQYRLSPKGQAWKRRWSWANNHKRRQKPHHQWDWSPDQWDRQVELFDRRCAYCGADKDLEQDHFIPLSDPSCPGTVPWNMVPACKRCSLRKGKKLPHAWCKDSAAIARIVALLDSLKPLACS